MKNIVSGRIVAHPDGYSVSLYSLGFGLLFSFDILLAMSSSVAGLPELEPLGITGLISVVLFVLAAIVATRSDFLANDRRVPLASMIAGTLGAGVILAFELLGLSYTTPVILALVLALSFQCAFILRYYRVFSTRPLAEIALTLALCHVLSGTILFVSALLNSPAIALVIALLSPAAAMALLVKYEKSCALVPEESHGSSESVLGDTLPTHAPVKKHGDGTESGSNPKITARIPLRPLFLLVMIIFMKSIFANPQVGNELAVSFSGVVAASALVFFVVLSKHPHLKFKAIYEISLFGMAIGFFFSAAGTLVEPETATIGFMEGFFTNAGYVSLEIFVVTLLCNSCQRNQLNPIFLFGILNAAEDLFLDLGLSANSFFLAQDPSIRALTAFGCTIVLVACYVLFLTDRDYRTSWGTSFEEKERPSVVDYYYTLPEICSALSQQHGLTKREEEVLTLLALRKTAPEIAAELYVSTSTVKSHCKNIYRKLGIHKREELLDLVGHPSRADNAAAES